MKTFIFAISLCFALVITGDCLAWQGRVKSVHDGDSLLVVDEEEHDVHVRLYGIDAPELRQSFGHQARKQLRKLVMGKQVHVETVDTDRYGRTVALVRTSRGGVLANEEMVRTGHAWVYEDYCHKAELCDSLRAQQQEARSAGRGLWVESSPVPPWQWRHENRTHEWTSAPKDFVKGFLRKFKR